MVTYEFDCLLGDVVISVIADAMAHLAKVKLVLDLQAVYV